jgi:hypothetical protein
MKNLKAPFLVIALLLLNVSLAKPEDMPVPGEAGKMSQQNSVEDCPACPPDFPINKNISFLIVGGVALGLASIYKKQIKKASI